jgi:hypothetical protein
MSLRTTTLTIIASFACAASGCGKDEPVDLGTHTALGAALSDYVGGWEGYAEAFTFDDGTDVVRLQLDGQGNGVIEFGDADPLPPPDPDRGYPVEFGEGDSPSGLWIRGRSGASAGFSYPIAGATVTDRRIRLSSSTLELYREWCALMPPVQDEINTDHYSCLPNVGYGRDEMGCYLGAGAGEEGPRVDCGKLDCFHICQCDANACGIGEPPGQDLQLDAALGAQGEELAGTLLIENMRVTVRLMRQ